MGIGGGLRTRPARNKITGVGMPSHRGDPIKWQQLCYPDVTGGRIGANGRQAYAYGSRVCASRNFNGGECCSVLRGNSLPLMSHLEEELDNAQPPFSYRDYGTMCQPIVTATEPSGKMV